LILVDAHCHLERKDFPDPASVIARARAAGVVHAVMIGQFHGPGDFGDALEVAKIHPDFLTPTMGIHPHDAALATESDWEQLYRLAALPEVVAVGEAGLDYYYDRSPRPVQQNAFRRQCGLAKELQKPLVVHVRDAHTECWGILCEEQISQGIIHCFTGDTEAARRYLDLGLHISISGIVTYKNAQSLQAAVQFIPLDRLMVETDSPFLAPVPHRGKKNEPALVLEVARKVAELKGLPVEQVSLVAARNAQKVFRLKLDGVKGLSD
jgi:TatD DNase family protein